MKKLFFCLLGGAMMLNSCTDDSGIFVPDGIKEPTLPVETKPNEVVNGDVFSKLNLDYPGLEKVKQHYEAGEHYLAAKELLEYYRWRSNVVNPAVPLYVTASKVDKNKANQALDYRFCVAKYVEKDGATDDLDEYYSFKKDDGTINWGYKPDVQGVDREFYYQQHRHQWMEPQAKAYAATKNEAYFNNWVDVYSSWMAAYPCPNKAFEDPKIYNLEPGYEWKALQPTERVLSQVNIIQYYLSSPNMTPEWFTTVLNAFAENVEMIVMNLVKDGNILVTQGRAIATAGLLFPEFAKAEEWVSFGVKTMDGQFREDGVLIDLDFGYHTGAVRDFFELYKLAKENNRLDVLPANYVEKLKGSMDFVADMIYPDYTVDNFNDTHSSSYNQTESNSVLKNNFRRYLEVFPDNKEYLWLSWEGEKGGDRPSWTSKAYKNSGYYMFRSKDWNKTNGIMMIHKNNDNSKQQWHCQPDNGTFSLWYNGVNFLPDAGSYSYNDPSEDRSKYRSYIIHNTVSYQGKDISESQQLGKFLKHEESDQDKKYELIVTQNMPYKAGENALNGDVSHRRAIFFVNNRFFVIVDEMYSSSDQDKIKANLNFHLIKESDNSISLSNILNENANVLYCIAKYGGKSLLMKAFYEKSTTDEKHNFSKVDQGKELSVSTKPGIKDGGDRYWVKLNCEAAQGKAVRHITVLYPSDGDADESKVSEAKFIDNESGQEGTFHPEGAAVKVRVDGQDYELKYTLQ